MSWDAIILRARMNRPREEKKAGDAHKPGHLVREDTSGNFVKVSSIGYKGAIKVAIEDGLDGSTKDTARTVGSISRVEVLSTGDRFQGRVAAGALALAKEDVVQHAGDGTVMKLSFSTAVLNAMTAASAVVSGTTTGNFTGTGSNYTIPAGTLKAGDVIDFIAFGNTPVTLGADTLNANLTLNGVAIATTGAVDVANGDTFRLAGQLVVQSIGASGTIVLAGTSAIGVPGTVTEKAISNTTITANTTADLTLRVTGVWSANTTNEAYLRGFTLGLRRNSNAEGICKVIEAVDNSAGVGEAFVKLEVL